MQSLINVYIFYFELHHIFLYSDLMNFFAGT